MQVSISSIFSSWKTNALIMLALLSAIALSTASDYLSHSKIQALQKQKHLMDEIADLNRDELELANIHFRGKSAEILFEVDNLYALHSYDFFGIALGQNEAYEESLVELKERLGAFTTAAEGWFGPSTKDLEKREDALRSARYAVKAHIARMIEHDAVMDYERFFIVQFVVYFALLHGFMMLLIHGKRFKEIQNDITAILGVDTSNGYEIVTDEMEAISKRMGRKPSTSDNPAMLDPQSGLLNHKGVMHAFANKAAPKDGSMAQTLICIFEIDGFKDITKQYSKEFTLNVYKKISFILSLYKQHSDIIGRIDEGKFILIVTRTSKEIAFNEFEQMRENIAETSFKVPKANAVNLTVSGGFAQKSGGKTLEETIQEAQQYLEGAELTGGNKIMKNRIK